MACSRGFEPSHADLIETGRVGPVISRVVSLWAGIVEARGADAYIGKDMESMVRNTQLFSEIHIQPSGSERIATRVQSMVEA
jgi:hypothetical protein